jgi:adenylate cyclase
VPEQRPQRQLSAILAADVAGYSRLIGRDEEGTLARLKELRRTLIDPKISEHRGRIVKTMGDGLLVQFASAVDAVRCAVDIQQQIAEQNAGIEEDRRIEFRIGINVGDVVIDEGDIYGDGVNIASRLEGLAELGGICISGGVYDHIRHHRLDVIFEEVGEQTLKNIAQPVRVFRARVRHSISDVLSAASDRNRPSIAVLPFVNMSGDVSEEHFADGLTEDIITSLSRSNTLLVIARTSAFAYKGKSIDVKRFGKELDVRYIIEGSVRRSVETVRVTAQLIDTATGHHLWAEKYDGPVSDVFELQDNITRAVAACTNTQIMVAAWKARRSASSEKSKGYQLALAAMGRLHEMSSEAYSEALRLAEDALELEPDLHIAHVARTAALLDQYAEGDIPRTDATRAMILEAATKTASLDQNSEYSRWVKAWALAQSDRIEEAVAEAERALEINPNSTMIIGDLGIWYAALGRADEAIAACKLALRLDPRDPLKAWKHWGLAKGYFVAGEYQQARDEARKVARTTKGFLRAGLYWAAAAAALDDLDDAKAAITHCLKQREDLRVGNIHEHTLSYLQKQDHERLTSMLRKAGLPE